MLCRVGVDTRCEKQTQRENAEKAKEKVSNITEENRESSERGERDEITTTDFLLFSNKRECKGHQENEKEILWNRAGLDCFVY